MRITDEHIRTVQREAGRHEKWARSSHQNETTQAIHRGIARRLREVAEHLQRTLKKEKA